MGEQRAGAERVGTLVAAAQRRMASTTFLAREEPRRGAGKKVAHSHCRPGLPLLLSPLSKAEARLSNSAARSADLPVRWRNGPYRSSAYEPLGILRRKLDANVSAHRLPAHSAKVVVEVAKPGVEQKRVDASRSCSDC